MDTHIRQRGCAPSHLTLRFRQLTHASEILGFRSALGLRGSSSRPDRPLRRGMGTGEALGGRSASGLGGGNDMWPNLWA